MGIQQSTERVGSSKAKDRREKQSVRRVACSLEEESHSSYKQVVRVCESISGL